MRWLYHRAPLQDNALIRLPERDVAAIFAGASGQQRVNELFRRAQRMRVTRTVVATVAMQDDYMKRVRDGGGARDQLRGEGIVIFGDYAGDQLLASALDLPRPDPASSSAPGWPGAAAGTTRTPGPSGSTAPTGSSLPRPTQPSGRPHCPGENGYLIRPAETTPAAPLGSPRIISDRSAGLQGHKSNCPRGLTATARCHQIGLPGLMASDLLTTH